MERALVVVDESDTHRELLRKAGELAAGTGAELIAFSWITPEQAESNADAREVIENIEGASYSEPDVLAPATKFAKEFARETFAEAGLDVEYDAEAVLTDDDELADAILDAADRRDCDHVFLVGRRRSPTGKAIFGDVAQRVILNFDGPVTVTMD